MAVGTRLTIAGAVLLAKAINGKALTFVRGAFGDATLSGKMANPTDAEQDNMKELIHERMSLPIQSYEMQEGGDLLVTLSVTNSKVASDFRIAEIGLFAKDPDTAEEILYGYIFEGDSGSKMYAKDSAVTLEYLYDLVTTIANAQNVNVQVQVSDKLKAGAGLTRSGDTMNVNVANETLLGGVKIGTGVYMTGDSINSYGANLEILERAVAQLEINQSNLFMRLDKENNLEGYTNLLLVEDFIDAKCVDQTVVDIDYVVQDNHHLKTTNPNHMDVGNDFVVVNAGMNQNLKVTNLLSYNNGAYWQIRPVPQAQFLDLTNTKLYRTTATLKDNRAYGPGSCQVRNVLGDAEFQGQSGKDATLVEFDTTSANSYKFDLTDDFAFTSAGYFTLAT